MPPLTHRFAMRRSGRCGPVPVAGHLTVPENRGIVVFAHGGLTAAAGTVSAIGTLQRS